MVLKRHFADFGLFLNGCSECG
jgi:Flp pilus assembly protein TadG